MPRWAASVAATAHSAVDGVCAPRALHSSTPSGSRPTNRSAPGAEQLHQPQARAAPSRNPSPGAAPRPRGTQTCAWAASPVGAPSAGVDAVGAHPRRERLDRRAEGAGRHQHVEEFVGFEDQAWHGARL